MQNQRFAVLGAALGMFIAAASISAALAQGGAEKIWPTAQWQTSTPEEQGMDSAALANLIDFGTTRSLDSLLLVRHGRIVLDAYYAPYAADIPHQINSVTKAVVGTLAAIAHSDGLLDSFDHPVLDFFPDRIFATADDGKNAITIQHLLDMTSGIDWKEPVNGRPNSMFEMTGQPNWVKFVLDRPMAHARGGGLQLQQRQHAPVVRHPHQAHGKEHRGLCAGKTVRPARDQRFELAARSARAVERRVRPGAAAARHGEDRLSVFARRPMGGQNAAAAWIDKVTHATVNMNASFAPDLRYSNLFWALPDKQVYMAVGYHCQVIMVLPRLDIVAVTTARGFYQLGILADTISGAVKSGTALPPDPAGANLLANKIREIATEKADRG